MTQLGFYPKAGLGQFEHHMNKPFDLPFSAIKGCFEQENPSYSKRVPNCQKCGQHNRKSRLKGHKRICPFRDCKCPKCEVVTERQKLMADQIKIRRRQRKDNVMQYTKESITHAMNAINAAGQMNFSFPNMATSLLYSQLKGSSLLTSPASSDSSSYSPPNTMNPFAASPDLLKHSLLLPPSPPSPQGLVAPVAINPLISSQQQPQFPFSLLNNEALLQILGYSSKLFEQKLDEPLELSNPIIDVCSV